MASQKDEHRRLFTTEEVLSFLRADSVSDETSSEGCDDDWETDESGISDVPIVKHAKLTISTVQLQEQQSSQPTNLPGASKNVDDDTNSALEPISEEITLSSEENSTTNDDLSSCDDERDGDWVLGDSPMDYSTTMLDEGENWQLGDVENIPVMNDDEHTCVENDGEYTHMENDGEHRWVKDTLVDNSDGINSESSEDGDESRHTGCGNRRGVCGSSPGGGSCGGDSSSHGGGSRGGD